VAFVFASAALAAVAELRPAIRDPMAGDKGRQFAAAVAARPGQPIVLALGSSRTGFAFNGLYAGHLLALRGTPTACYNYGVPAAGPIAELQNLRRTLAAGIVPDLVVVEVLPIMLHADPSGPHEHRLLSPDRFDAGELARAARFGFPEPETTVKWWKARLAPWWTYRFQLLGRASPSWLPFNLRFDFGRNGDPAGWGTFPFTTVDAETKAKGLARAHGEYAPLLSVLNPGGGACDALRELINLCRERGIAVRVVLLPESTEFRAWYAPGVDDRLAAFLASLSAMVIDARDWIPDDQFADGHHLLQAGTMAFTEKLVDRVLAPALEARRAARE
jgi:hypothetical protein